MSSDLFLGHVISRRTLTIAGHSLEIIGPADQDALLEDPTVQERFEQDEYLPYWGQLWPAAVMLADHVLCDERGDGRRALEIGCGLGLVSIAARIAGWDVVATDYDEDALAFVGENAHLNGFDAMPTRILDWRKPAVLERFDRIFGSDVLYEQRNHEPVAALIDQLLAPSGVALLSDPNRDAARGFDQVLHRIGLTCGTRSTHANQPHGRYVEGTIHRIRRPCRADGRTV